MNKKIVLRYAAKCDVCGKQIAAGETAFWKGKGKGTTHVTCAEKPKEIQAPKADPTNAQTHIWDYSEILATFRQMLDDPRKVYRQDQNADKATSLRSAWTPDWVGCSVQEMQDWISNGYRVQGLDGVTSLIPARPRRRVKYAEEGDELLINLALAGEDEPFMDWEKRNRKPGLSVEIHTTFSSMISSKPIVSYQRWVARALQTLDEAGVDMEVNIVVRTSGADGYDYDRFQDAKIRVRKAGEASDFSNWSAMFSPGGYRMLGILATGMTVDSAGGSLTHGYGRPQDYGRWEVAYDAERNVVVFGNHNSNDEFPEEEMTGKLRTVLEMVSG